MGQQHGVHAQSGILCSHEKEWGSDTGYNVDGTLNTQHSGREGDTEGHYLSLHGLP